VRNLVVEASYVANRQIWLTNTALVNYNYLSTQLLSSSGLNLNNPADVNTLNSTLSSAAAGRFQNKLPFAGFPTSSTVAQSLRPFPQFSSALAAIWSPLGNAWYDSLQMKVTKRYSHGLDLTYAFTWSKELDTLSLVNDVQNRANSKSLSANSRPLISGIGFNYTLPAWGKNKALSFAVRDWQIGGFVQYASALPFAPPAANNSPSLAAVSFQNTFQNRVPSEPVFTQDLNCHCFDPNTTFVLNPKAWVNPGPGQFGSGTYYGDFRQQRRPLENLAFGRLFRIRERMNLNLRIEFTNVFNRTEMANPTVTSPQAVQTRVNSSPNSQTTAGYGYINNSTVAQPARQGQIVARFQF
jgi:hypothetical protein